MSPERLNRVLQQAIAHHREGRLAEAEALYRQVQMMAPRNFDALHLSGLLAHQQGRVAEAVDLLPGPSRSTPARTPARSASAMPWSPRVVRPGRRSVSVRSSGASPA